MKNEQEYKEENERLRWQAIGQAILLIFVYLPAALGIVIIAGLLLIAVTLTFPYFFVPIEALVLIVFIFLVLATKNKQQ